ncbi:Phosphoribosylformylglycinamidine cyclo-ligase [Aquisphaera giovannonii]|uniref:Phosphoribosylformylglycinamidine cyclo-ligase n=1 Tax=Aquisphaera giovannonii TaxID=406548 RepID=A0A5B9W884_9BACT|nr:phosphoribosylformylglycinamidine cyclo-ligase [Aquisphaera giovannonii]QEH36295.1 Phosphoribosylformylglycinamidine cyclo-ligase [Aquisphaera giovannonii]
MSESLDYRAAGVDLNTYEETMARLPPLMRRTFSPRVMEWKDGFAGLFRLDDQIGLLSRRYRDPIMVASTDGVGTKLKVAVATGRHGTVGIDLVAMSVNDCLCAGAEPLIFLDYVAMSRDDPALTAEIVKGISDGCIEAECSLIGGETAILPEFYQPGEYDLAGFCLGVVDRKQIVDGKDIRRGDKVIGLASSGLHSNGYSLARKIVERSGLALDARVEALGRTVGEELLAPTRIYTRPLKTIRRNYRVKKTIHGIAHITGGGLIDNPPRVLPEGLSIRLERGSWQIPPVFRWLQALGGVSDPEMFRVFNMGIGLVLIVAEYYADSIVRHLNQKAGVPAWIIGEVIPGGREVQWA